MTESAQTRVLDAAPRVYWQRWYIMILFSLITMWSCAVWNTWGPVADSAKKVFGWEDSTIAMFTNWGSVDFIIFSIPSAYALSWSLRERNIFPYYINIFSRGTVVCGSLLMTISCAVRCLPLVWPEMTDDVFTWMCHLSEILCSIPGPVYMAAPIQISATWFPPNERTTATSIGQMFNALGVGMSFVLGTFVVNNANQNSDSSFPNSTNFTNSTDGELQNSREHIYMLMYIHAGVSLGLFSLAFIYFPSTPPSPPSKSASVERMKFLDGLKSIVKSKSAWFLMLTYALSQGLVQMWQTVMVINMTSLDMPGVTESWASTMGIVISFSAVLISIITARFMDYFKGHMKIAIIVLLTLAGIIFIFVTLLTQEVIVFEDSNNFKISMYALLIAGISLACSVAPISFEFTVEMLYPIHEGIIGCWLSGWFMTIAFFFFIIFLFPVGTSWLNYVLPFSVFAPLPFILSVDESYNRLSVDNAQRSAGISVIGNAEGGAVDSERARDRADDQIHTVMRKSDYTVTSL